MRGQTTLDFAIGISVFLAVILFVFTFVPGLLEPFAVSGESDTVQANQIADRLAHGQLGDPEEPYVLDRYCTVEFFGGSEHPNCRWDGDSWQDRLDVSGTTNVNVTLEQNATVGADTPDTKCWDETNAAIVSHSSPDCDTPLTMGRSLEGAGGDSTITARRVVTVHDREMTLKVVVW